MSEQKKLSIHEDWVVVILGALIILVSLAGLLLPVPVFSWKSTSDLSATVFSGGNLQNIGLQFLFVIVIAIIGAALTGKSIAANLKTFPVVYILTMLALVIAGNSTIKYYGLEAVIFSLLIGLLISNLFALPEWFRSALSTELFVKIGLVLLGTGVIFSDIL
jgi:hypothetical protein